MTLSVLSREVLHNNSSGHDKVYVVEVLERGGRTAHFTSYGKRGATLKSAHVSGTDASTKLAEKLAGGYQPKSKTVGLTLAENDKTVPLTQRSVYDTILPPSAAPAATPTVVEPPKPEVLDLDSLEREFRSIVTKGVHAGKVPASAITPAGTEFQVQGSDATPYTVTLNPMTCSCPAFRTSSPAPCKHLEGVIANHGESWMRGQRADALVASLGVDAPEAVAPPKVAPAAVKVDPTVIPADPIAAIFSEFIREGEEHPLVPFPENLVWNEAHARRLAAGFRRRKPVLCYGPTGTGKTSYGKDFARRTNRPLMRMNMTEQTTIEMIVGHWIVKEGATVWVDGPLTEAMRFGYLLLVDEVDRGLPGVNAAFYSAMEDMPTLTLMDKGCEVVEAHPDFAMIGTANSMGGLHDEAGIYNTPSVDAALVRRFGMQIRVGYAEPAIETAILVGRGIPAKIADKVVRASGLIRSMIDSKAVNGAWGTGHAINFAENAKDLNNWQEGFSATAEGSFTAEEYMGLWNAVQKVTTAGALL